MTLKLPESLPYDFVDEYLDAEYEFLVEPGFCEYGESGLSRFACWRKDSTRSNYGRDLMELIKPHRELEEDGEGFCEWDGSGGMVWTAEEIPKEDIDYYIDCW